MGRLIDVDEYEKRIKPYDTEDVMDKALYNFAHEKLITTPSAQPEQKKEKWIGVTPMVDALMCSECGYNIIDEEFKTPYCPNCGSDNRGEQDE